MDVYTSELVKKFKNEHIDYPLPFSTNFPNGLSSGMQSKLKSINVATHSWIADIDRACVCMVCDCRYSSHTSEWPCGYPVPRSGDLK